MTTPPSSPPDPFTPTHEVPDSGMQAWSEPDGTRPPVARLDPRLPVQVTERRGEWARLRCSNAWECWVDARLLVASGPAPAYAEVPTGAPAAVPPSFVATHAVPSSGLAAWSEPDGTRSPIAQLDPGLAVQVVEQRGAWARVRCSNAWEAWVDARRLTAPQVDGPPGAAGPASWSSFLGRSVQGVAVVSLVGGAMAFIGSFLPWWSLDSLSDDAWNIPIKYLVAGGTGTGVGTGLLLLLPLLVALPILTRRPLPTWATVVLGLIPILAAVVALIRGLGHSVSPGFGLFVTLIGGLLILVEAPAVKAYVARLLERRPAPRS